jgi:hypothetical protein
MSIFYVIIKTEDNQINFLNKAQLLSFNKNFINQPLNFPKIKIRNLLLKLRLKNNYIKKNYHIIKSLKWKDI